MPTFSTIEKFTITLPEVTVEPHFEKISFRIKRKIFLTYDQKSHRATVKLSPIDQDVFSSASDKIYAVNGKWGEQGWTLIELDGVNEKLLKDAITTSFCEVAPKTFAKMVRSKP